jgi:hypothetical protein
MEVTLHMKGFEPRTYVFCTACTNAFIHRYVGEKGHKVTTRVYQGSRDPIGIMEETSAPGGPRREMSWRELLFGKRRPIL